MLAGHKSTNIKDMIIHCNIICFALFKSCRRRLKEKRVCTKAVKILFSYRALKMYYIVSLLRLEANKEVSPKIEFDL